MSTNGVLLSNGSSQDDDHESARLGSVIYLCVIGVCGVIANSLVIFVFWKYPKLRTAANLFILNLAVCDLMLSLLDNAFSIASTLHGKWLFGRGGCISYGFFHYFFICCTVSTLAAISVDRFFFITRPSQTRAVQIITRRKAIGILAIIYLYTILFTFPPCVGWNNFVEEAIFYSGCYINYGDQRTSSIAYSVIAPFFLFLIPLTIMIYCYARIFFAVRRSTQRTIGRSLGTQTSVRKRHPLLKRTHIQTAKMIIVVIFFSMIVWVPYVVVSFIKAANGHIAPLVSHITVLVAKSCVIYNVLIYAILNRKLKAAILDAVCCGRQTISLVGTPSSGNNAHKNRISRILSETDVPSPVGEAQKNRLSALSIQQSSDSVHSQYADNISAPRSPKLKNGIWKAVEFKDEERKDNVVENAGKEGAEVSGSAADSHLDRNGSIETPSGTYTRKKVSKLQRPSDASQDNVEAENIVSLGATEVKSAYLNSDGVTKDSSKYTPSVDMKLTAGSPLASSIADSVPQRIHHLYSSRNSRSQTLSSPSQLYKKGSRPISAQQVTKRISPASSVPRASSSTDQESDTSRGHSREPSREHSREGSFVHRSASSRRTKKPRSANRTNAKHPPSRRKSYSHVSYGRRGGAIDPLHTTAQELLEIQNYWKRMSLCLDDIDLDDVTRGAEMV